MKHEFHKMVLALSGAALLLGNNTPPVATATETTKKANAAVAARLPIADQTDFDNANKGLIAQIEAEKILNEDGSVAWDNKRFEFMQGPAPTNVNPSLWRQGKLNAIHGLFKVTDGIYQIRGYDLSVMTLIAGKKGWVIIDPLLTPAPAKAGLELAQKILGKRPVSAVIYTHSHGDHFGGVRGVISDADIASGTTQVIAPFGFTEEAVAENLIAGTHMNRRAQFQFGSFVPAGKAGQVGTGLGQALSRGNVGLIAPTKEIGEEGGTLTVDGITLEFLDASQTEAPAEFVIYLPQFKALHTAEVVTRNFHNVLTPRGALARDTLKWSKAVNRMLMEYGEKSDVMLASHHWPTWGKDNVAKALRNQRDLYRYVHDQTLRGANNGKTIVEIAEDIPEPDFAAKDFGVRDYYGTMNHNSKAVYQRYFGWWDGNPANYNRHTPVNEAKRYVAAMGGSDKAIAVGKKAFEDGDYRWAATVLNHVVFAEPANKVAKNWLASAYEQLAFQAESGAWRNYYLTGTLELRNGKPKLPERAIGSLDLLKGVPTINLLDSLAVRFDPKKMTGDAFSVQFNFTDEKSEYVMEVGKSVLFPYAGKAEDARTTVALSRADFNLLLAQQVKAPDLIKEGRMKLSGDPLGMRALFASFDKFEQQFNVVTP